MTFKMNSRPPQAGEDLNLPDIRFYLTKLEIPRNERKEVETEKEY
jgi:hypothetical protein